MTTVETLIAAIGETKCYDHALQVVEQYYPYKDDAWVIATTDKILELIMEAA